MIDELTAMNNKLSRMGITSPIDFARRFGQHPKDLSPKAAFRAVFDDCLSRTEEARTEEDRAEQREHYDRVFVDNSHDWEYPQHVDIADWYSRTDEPQDGSWPSDNRSGARDLKEYLYRVLDYDGPGGAFWQMDVTGKAHFVDYQALMSDDWEAGVTPSRALENCPPPLPVPRAIRELAKRANIPVRKGESLGDFAQRYFGVTVDLRLPFTQNHPDIEKCPRLISSKLVWAVRKPFVPSEENSGWYVEGHLAYPTLERIMYAILNRTRADGMIVMHPVPRPVLDYAWAGGFPVSMFRPQQYTAEKFFGLIEDRNARDAAPTDEAA